MKILKGLGIGIVSIIILLLIATFFLPKKLSVEQSKVIEAPADAIFAQVIDFKNWEAWSPFHKMDPNMTFEYGDVTSGQGASYAWNSEAMGPGTQSFTEVVPNKSITTRLEFGEQGGGNGFWTFEETEAGTKVTWKMEGDETGFAGRWMNAIMGATMGKTFAQGLNDLAEVAKNAEPIESMEFVVSETPAMTVLAIRENIPMTEYSGDTYGRLFGELSKFCGDNNIEVAGMPMTIYYGWGEMVDMECCLPVASGVKGNKRVVVKEIGAGKSLMAVHSGPYENLEATYKSMIAYMSENNMTSAGPQWEQYLNDPEGIDPSEIKTAVYMPISNNNEGEEAITEGSTSGKVNDGDDS